MGWLDYLSHERYLGRQIITKGTHPLAMIF
jgi:hypothetical protein